MRQAIRSLLNSPGYTTIALLTLALGIGVNTAMFSVIDALLFRSGPFPEPDRLVQLVGTTRQGEMRAFSATELREIRGQASSFESLTTIAQTQFGVSEPGQPAERLSGFSVSADFFATFGIQPMRGRAFTAEEFRPGNNHVVLLSYACWQQRYGGAADILGRTLRLDGQTVTIVGVMPPSFDYRLLWGGAALWRPLDFTPDQLEWRDYRAFHLLGRLKPSASLIQTAAELAPLAATQEKAHPESYSGLRYRVLPLNEALMDKLGRKISWMLLGLSGFVLLIACANLANLQLARATANVRELAIRAALGASRAALVRQQLTESVLLAFTGGALGLAVAFGINRLVDRSFVVDGTAGGLRVAIHAPILGLTVLVCLITGIIFGLVPAWFASRTDVNSALKQQGRGSSTGRGHHRMRQSLIIGEISLALVLLSGAALLQRGFSRLLERDAGWDTEHVLTASLPIPETLMATDPIRIEFFRKLEAKLALLPGVDHVALATSLPIFSYNGDRQILTEGQTPGDTAQVPAAYHVMVTPGYFATLGIPLVEGRLFPEDISAKSPRVIVVNERLAKQLWPGRSAVGQRLGSMDSGKPYWAEVIGVVRDVDTAASTSEPSIKLHVYKPLVHEAWSHVQVLVRSAAPATLADAVRRTISEIAPDLATSGIGTVRQIVDYQQHNLVLAAQALTAFAALGMVLAAVGLYGVIANLVAQRRGEFGIRLALGARPRDVLTLVLKHGIQLTAIGLGLGAVGAYALGKLLASMMPRVAIIDPVALVAVAAILFLVAVFACWIPAKRATAVNPLEALRAE